MYCIVLMSREELYVEDLTSNTAWESLIFVEK